MTTTGNATISTIPAIPAIMCGNEECPTGITDCCYSSNPWYGTHSVYCCHAEQKAKLMQTTLIVVSGWVLLILFIIMMKCCKMKFRRGRNGGSCACSPHNGPTEDKLPTYEDIMRHDRENANKMQVLPGYDNMATTASASTSVL